MRYQIEITISTKMEAHSAEAGKSDWSVCMGESESAYLCYWVLLLFFFADVNSKKKAYHIIALI